MMGAVAYHRNKKSQGGYWPFAVMDGDEISTSPVSGFGQRAVTHQIRILKI
jgi:hypothetical protein